MSPFDDWLDYIRYLNVILLRLNGPRNVKLEAHQKIRSGHGVVPENPRGAAFARLRLPRVNNQHIDNVVTLSHLNISVT
jgi:hypothetical protein